MILAKSVLKQVGGEANVSHLEHCSTRLRFSIVDAGKVDKDALKAIPGVMGVVSSGNQRQVIIGNDVIEVYNELLKQGSINAFQIDYSPEVFRGLVFAFEAALVFHVVLIGMPYLFRKAINLTPVEQASLSYPNSGEILIPLVVSKHIVQKITDNYAYKCFVGCDVFFFYNISNLFHILFIVFWKWVILLLIN